MPTITDWKGCKRNLSNEVYEIYNGGYDEKWLSKKLICGNYSIGTKVRLISGVDGKRIPGYHFYRDYLSVCRVDAEEAECVGIPGKCLRLVSEEAER